MPKAFLPPARGVKPRARRLWALVLVAANLVMVLPGCGYVLTYNQAFPPPPLYFPAFTPPDSVAFAMPEPPPVETVIMNAELYFKLNPQSRPIILAPTKPAPKSRAQREAETLARARADSAAVADSLALAAAADSVALAAQDSLTLNREQPGVRVDLSSRLEEAYISRADRDLAAARKLVSLLGKLKLNREETAQLQAVEGFVKRAERALTDRDFEGASNLAFKARTLAESLVESRP